jgi:small conductance mechanosensitive channel
VEGILNSMGEVAVGLGSKVLGAIALWVIGRWAIGMALKLTTRALSHRKMDDTLTKYLVSALQVVLNVLLIITILGVFGIQTTSFAAVFAAAGVAIGMAWSGLLSNFAAGIMMMVLRPFKVGDFIQAGGTMGTVQEIGLFVTTINTLDNVRNFVGNGAIFGGTIQNFTANEFRRVDLKAQLAHGADVGQAIEILLAAVGQISNLDNTAGICVEVLEFNLAGPVLAVRPHCHNKDYWQVYFDTNRAIRESLGAAGFPVPQTHHAVQTTAT